MTSDHEGHAADRSVSVLLATDGQPPARTAEQLVTRIADRHSVTITVIGVSSYELALSQGVRTEGHYSPRAALRHVEQAVTTAAERLTAEGFDTHTRIEHDDATLRILEAAREIGSDLIVLGGRTWGRSGPVSALDGHDDAPGDVPPTGSTGDTTATVFDSVSTRVAHRADVPVVVVHGEPVDAGDDATATVVLGVDGSPASAAAVAAFAALAQPRQVDVVVVGVMEPDPNLTITRFATGDALIALGTRMARVDGDTARAVIDRTHDGVGAIAARTADELAQRGFATRVEIVEGAPAAALLDVVGSAGASLVVEGSRGLGRIRRALLGSVSETLLHAAPATMIAHAPEGSDDASSDPAPGS